MNRHLTFASILALSALVAAPLAHADSSCSNSPEIDEVNRKIQDLEKQKQALEQQAESLSCIKSIHSCLSQRLQEITSETSELNNNSGSDCPEAKPKHEARLQFLKAQAQTITQALALQKPTDLPQVRSLQDTLESRDIEWNTLTGPNLEAETHLASLTHHAAENQAKPEKLAQLEKIREALNTAKKLRENQLKLIHSINQLSKQVDSLTQEFYSCQ